MGKDRVEPFSQRYGLHAGPSVDGDFPPSARAGLFHVLLDLVAKSYVEDWSAVEREIERAGRAQAVLEGAICSDSVHERLEAALQGMPWTRVFEFTERVYRRLLTPVEFWDGDLHEYITKVSLEEVQGFFSEEINDLLGEENLSYRFEDGVFVRPGRFHTQQMSASASKVLGLPELAEARLHFGKARRFFEAAPMADYPNSVKEAVSALESAVKVLFPAHKKSDVMDVIRSLRGTGQSDIPPTIVKGMEAAYAFRGAATGVAHGGASGGVASSEIAELILNLVASYIVYLVDLAARRDGDAPF